jgi:hypothetical protein
MRIVLKAFCQSKDGQKSSVLQSMPVSCGDMTALALDSPDPIGHFTKRACLSEARALGPNLLAQETQKISARLAHNSISREIKLIATGVIPVSMAGFRIAAPRLLDSSLDPNRPQSTFGLNLSSRPSVDRILADIR